MIQISVLQERAAATDLTDCARNDSGLAEMVVALFYDQYRYVPDRGWMAWAGTHWMPDSAASIIEAVATTLDFMVVAADRLSPDGTGPKGEGKSERDKFLAWVSTCGNTRVLYAVEKRLQTWPKIVARSEDWDADPYALTHQSGTTNLRTELFEPHNPKDLITHCAPADPILAGHGERWSAFLEQVLPSPELRAYTQRAIGCSIIGKQKDHVIFMATGGGGNGKGTLFRAIKAAIGEYYSAISSNMLIEAQSERHTTEIADLMGRRLCVSSEIPSGKFLDETKVKELTGNDQLTARFMRKDNFRFQPTHTLWICANRKPRIKGTDNGIWRRIKVITFNVTIAPEDMDKDLDDKLEAERDVILAWCIEGARLYHTIGLGTCDEVVAATGDYRKDEDFLGMALQELCVFGPHELVTKKVFRAALDQYYLDNGLPHAPSDPTLARDFESRGIDSKRTKMARYWTGIRMRHNLDADDSADLRD